MRRRNGQGEEQNRHCRPCRPPRPPHFGGLEILWCNPLHISAFSSVRKKIIFTHYINIILPSSLSWRANQKTPSLWNFCQGQQSGALCGKHVNRNGVAGGAAPAVGLNLHDPFASQTPPYPSQFDSRRVRKCVRVNTKISHRLFDCMWSWVLHKENVKVG